MRAPKIIFEEASFLVLDKPAGWVVNRAETTKDQQTIQDWLEEKLEIGNWKLEIPSDFIRRAGIVHRLDKETSGLLLVAKTPAAFANLQRQFKERRVVKRYLALVHGKIQPQQGEIKAAISRSPFDRKKFGVFLGGRPAVTKYKILGYYNTRRLGKFSLLELEPKTGRTHQIRVHLKHLGYPIVGDDFYAGRKTARLDRKWCGRQFLHASALTFFHPETREKLEFTSLLPEDLEAVMKKL